jgi:hypothetical protein
MKKSKDKTTRVLLLKQAPAAVIHQAITLEAHLRKEHKTS